MPDALAPAPVLSWRRGDTPSMRRLEMVRATGTKMWVWGAVAALTIGMVGIGGPATAAPPDDEQRTGGHGIRRRAGGRHGGRHLHGQPCREAG